LDRYKEVVMLTHVPPLREACWHEGNISDDEWAPHFTCKAVGDVLLEVMPDYPDHSLMVLCGHTHGRGETHPLPNLRILTGAAQYGNPDIEQIFQFR
jgi:Icc-related predicted phosphoesterase